MAEVNNIPLPAVSMPAATPPGAPPAAPASRQTTTPPGQMESLRRSENDAREATRRKVKESRQVILKGYMVPKNIRLDIYEETGDLFAKILNADTGDLVRTVPPMAMLETKARIHRYLGILLDRYA